MTQQHTDVDHGNRLTGVESTIDRLAQIRDEQKLKLHLAKADLRDEWEKLETRWDQLHRRFGDLEDVAEDAAKDVWAGVEILVEEIGHGYEKIRQAM